MPYSIRIAFCGTVLLTNQVDNFSQAFLRFHVCISGNCVQFNKVSRVLLLIHLPLNSLTASILIFVDFSALSVEQDYLNPGTDLLR